jgi:uncharacterized membrane protein YfcA
MITRRYLEKKSTVLGLPMKQVGMLALLIVVLSVSGNILKMLFTQVHWFNHLTLIVVIGSYALMRYAASKKHPSFLISYISYFLLQRRKYFIPMSSHIILNRK